MPIARIALLCLCAAAAGSVRSEYSARPDGTIPFVLAGERIGLGPRATVHFTERQVRATAAATRAGFVRWAMTPSGRTMIARFVGDEYEINVVEDATEQGPGRAPEPGLATLAAAQDHSRHKSYELILNPVFYKLPRGMTPLPDQPRTADDMMAAAWAGEMLHIWFYAQGVSLPHHQRADFQRQWRIAAAELGLPTMRHDDQDDFAAPGGATVVLSGRR